MSRGALLTGTAGAIIGAITAVFGIIWVYVYNILLNELYYYLWQIQAILSIIFPWPMVPPWPRSYFGPPPIPIFPSWSLFGLSSYIIATFFIVTGILIGIGFYGTYKIGGGAMGIVGLIFGIIGGTLGALLIILGNITAGGMSAYIMVEMSTMSVLSVPTPNFVIMWLGFIALGLAFIIIGAASISIREMTMKPSVSLAAGIISIIGAMFFIGGLLMQGIVLVIGCALMFVVFILWAVVFFYSRDM
nr:hypothetical protein [Candidatus Freyarchaeota archaeon]